MSIKQIARTLGKRPQAVVPLVNAVLAADTPEKSEPGLVGCWVSPGWSYGLGVQSHPEWRDIEDPGQGPGGLAGALVVRRHRTKRVSACGFLIDTQCLGLKDVLGPRIVSDRDLPAFVQLFFGAFEEVGRPIRAPLELARQLVYGGIEAARRLGFEPHPDFPGVADHLGSWHGDVNITFGMDNAPSYVAGPYDDARSVIKTLTRSVGEGNFTFVAPTGSLR